MWDKVRTWVIGQKRFAFLEMAMELPGEGEFWRWKKNY